MKKQGQMIKNAIFSFRRVCIEGDLGMCDVI